MRFISKLTCLGLCAAVLSGCSLTQGVAQVAYNSKADSDCQSQLSHHGSIHRNVKSSCDGSSYAPDGPLWDPNAILKKESDKGIKIKDVTASE